MKFSEAMSILELRDDDLGNLQKAYRGAMRKFHPDVTELEPTFALEMAKLVNLAYEFLQENPGKWHKGHIQPGFDLTGEILAVYDQIRHIPGIVIHLAGIWLWVEILTPPEYSNSKDDTVQSRLKKKSDLSSFRKGIGAKLKETGFRYASNKQKWSWHSTTAPASPFKKKGGWEWDRIRKTFGDEELETTPHTAVA